MQKVSRYNFHSIGNALLSMNRPKLKATAVPSWNLPKSQTKAKLHQSSILQRRQRYEKRNTLRDINIIPEPLSETTHSHVQHVEEGEHRKMEFTDLTEDEKIVVQSLLDLQCTGSQGLMNSFKDKEVQVTSGDLMISFSSTIIYYQCPTKFINWHSQF